MVVQYYAEYEDGSMEPVNNEEMASHVVLDIEDYRRLLEASGSGQVDNLIAQAKSDSDGRSEPEPVDSDKLKIQELERALRGATNRANYERSMNEGYRRIHKERANADRKLKPKKEHSGYVILFSGEREKFGFVNKQRQTVFLMETVMQTPYGAQFNIGQVKFETLELTTLQPDGTRLVDVIGLGPLYKSKTANASLNAILNEIVALPKEEFEQARRENLILHRNFNLNAKAGYWEVTLLHMAPLTCYHATMMPTPKKQKEPKPE